MSCAAGTPVADVEAALAAARPARRHPAGWDGRRRPRRRTQQHPPPRRRPGARCRAAGPLRLGRRRGRQGRRADGQERQRVRPVPLARRVTRHARVHRRRDPAHATARPGSAWFRGERRPVRRARLRCTGRCRSCGTGRRRGCCSRATSATSPPRRLLLGLSPADGPPELPAGGRWSIPPERIPELTGTFVAEVGVGIVHHADAAPPRSDGPGGRRAAPADQGALRPHRPAQPRRRPTRCLTRRARRRRAAEAWQLPPPELLRSGMNAVFVAGEAVLRVSTAAPGRSSSLVCSRRQACAFRCPCTTNRSSTTASS